MPTCQILDATLQLPFDMFQRYMLTKEVIKRTEVSGSFSILDVGGHPGTISRFFPDQKTFVTDLKTCRHPNFVRADCEFLPFKTGAFEIATNLDVLEHLPEKKRIPVLEELLRVASRYLVVGAPFNSHEVRHAEESLREYIANVLEKSDPNLIEHALNGLPDFNEICRFLDSRGLTHLEFPNGYLATWLAMQKLNFRAPSKAIFEEMNELYNVTFYEHDNRTPSYRTIILVDKMGSSKLRNAMEPVRTRETTRVDAQQLLDFISNSFDALYAEKAKSRGLSNQIRKLERSITELNAQLNQIERKFAIRPILRNRLMKLCLSLLDNLFPNGTRRGQFASIIVASARISLNEGLVTYTKQVLEKIKRVDFTIYAQPSNNYNAWLDCTRPTEQILMKMRQKTSCFDYQPKISIIMPIHNTNEKCLTVTIDSVIKQTYPHWELCIVNASNRLTIANALNSYTSKDSRVIVQRLENELRISRASNEALRMATGDFVGFLDQDDELTPDALYELVRVLNENSTLDLIYSDEDKRDFESKRIEPFFKPDWSPDLLMSLNYISHFSAVRKSVIEKVGGFHEQFEGSHDYDLFLRVTEITDKIGHIPKILYSQKQLPYSYALTTDQFKRGTAMKALREALARRNLKGVISREFGNSYRVRYFIENAPLVSIIIPTRNRVDLLQRCISNLESKTHYSNYEIIIVDNNSDDKRTLTYLGSLRHKVLQFDGEFNFSKINNFAAAHAKGDHLLFLNNDTEVIDEHWLEAMLEHSQRPEVGMVGTLLLYPKHKHNEATIQHAGVIVGLVGVASHAFVHLSADKSNYFGLHRLVRNCSAVTGACVMVKRKVFDEVGGFDEKFKVTYGDIDLCLRVLEKGYRNIYTPYAVMYHHECATRGRLDPDDDEKLMINRWKEFIIKGDPYYNSNLTLLRADYSVASNGSEIRPLSLLIDIYNLRRDLRTNYPETSQGDYRRLVEWAVTHGPTDKASRLLRPYTTYYISHLFG